MANIVSALHNSCTDKDSYPHDFDQIIRRQSMAGPNYLMIHESTFASSSSVGIKG